MDDHQESRRQALRSLLLVCSSAQFVLLTVLAMLVYPGGAVYSMESDRYLFFGNFFSDLGATRTPSGRSNLLSHVLFVIALGCVGLALIQFAPAWKTVAAPGRRRGLLGITAQGTALIAGIGFVGIALTPWNHVLDAHNAFVRAAFGFLLVYIGCLSLLQRSNAWSRVPTRINFAYLLLLLLYVLVLFAGPSLQTQSGLEFQVAAQKVIVYASVVNLGIQAMAIRRAALERASAA